MKYYNLLKEPLFIKILFTYTFDVAFQHSLQKYIVALTQVTEFGVSVQSLSVNVAQKQYRLDFLGWI